MALSLRLEGVVCFFTVLLISFIVRSCIPNMKGRKTLIHVVTSGYVYNISKDMRYKLHNLPIQCTGFSQLSAQIIFTVLMHYHHKLYYSGRMTMDLKMEKKTIMAEGHHRRNLIQVMMRQTCKSQQTTSIVTTVGTQNNHKTVYWGVIEYLTMGEIIYRTLIQV